MKGYSQEFTVKLRVRVFSKGGDVWAETVGDRIKTLINDFDIYDVRDQVEVDEDESARQQLAEGEEEGP